MKRIIAATTIALCFAAVSAFAASAGEVSYRVTIRDTEIAPVEEIAASLAGTYGGEVSSGDISGRSFVIVTTPERAKLMLENRSVARIESLSAGSNAHAPRMTTNIQVDLGTYLYDGSGNIRTIDIDNYVYDKVGRVKTATVSSVSQSYNYDAFGNLNTITTGGGVLCAGQVVCGRALTVSSQTNHITSDNAHYTDAGSLDSLDSYTYTYDDVGMMTQQRIGTAIVRQFVYTADDERLATYVPSGVWSWTVRDLSGAVLRTFTSQDSGSNLAAANWQWNEDYIYRGSLLLATKSALGVRHLHLDHLGSPRLITDDSGHQTGIHKSLPFGAELNVGTRENPEEPRKFTGHERDGLNVASTLDYMHARYYGWGMGRFLSVDKVNSATLDLPQSWNKYIYANNSPLILFDPDGLAVKSYSLIASGKNNVSVRPSRDQAPDTKNLGPQTSFSGAFLALNVQIDFDTGDDLTQYRIDREAFAESPAPSELRLGGPGGREQPNDPGQVSRQNGSIFVYDSPGNTATTREGMPANRSNLTMTHVSVYEIKVFNKSTNTFDPARYYYMVRIDVRNGTIVKTYAEPISEDQYRKELAGKK